MALVGPVIEHRPQGELVAQLNAIAAMRGLAPDYAEQLAGIDAAIRWVLGEASVAPVSGESITAPTWPQASAEADFADEAMRGLRPMPDGAGREFANGVWIGISWAYGEIDGAPGPLA